VWASTTARRRLITAPVADALAWLDARL